MIAGERASDAGHRQWSRAVDVRILQGLTIAAEEGTKGAVTFTRPIFLAGGEFEGDAEADQVDDARSQGGLIEVGETATETRDRVLLEMSVAVQVHIGKATAGVAKLGADGLSEPPADETKGPREASPEDGQRGRGSP